MRFLPYFRSICRDTNGVAVAGASIQVLTSTGAAASLYADRQALVALPSNVVVSNPAGGFSFYARPGEYRLIGTASGRPVVEAWVLVGSGGNEETGIVYLADYLNASASNVLAAFAAAMDVAANKKASGKFGRTSIECEWAKLPIPDTLVFPSALTGDMTVAQIGMLYPTGGVGDWLEVADANALAYFNKYQTVTAQGKTWSQRKPLVRLETGAGFTLLDCFLDGKGDSSVRLAAGHRVPNNVSDRIIKGGKTTNVESYGILIGHDAQNSGQIDIEGHEYKPNNRTSRLERTSYGIASGGNDMQWLKNTVSNCHVPLQFGESGSTTNLLGCDLFNGANFDTEGFYHRLVETHGNSNTFVGGRSGNGVWVVYNANINVGPTKFGVTEGAGETLPPSAFLFVAKTPNSEINGFNLHLSETPIDLVTTIPLFAFTTEGTGTWKMATAHLSDIRGHVAVSSKGKNFYVNLAPTDEVLTFIGTQAKAMIALRSVGTDKLGGIGVEGNKTQIWTGNEPTWEMPNNKNFRPVGDNLAELGGANNRIRLAHINAQPANNTAPTLANNEWGVQRVSNTVLRMHFKGGDGVLRTSDLTFA